MTSEKYLKNMLVLCNLCKDMYFFHLLSGLWKSKQNWPNIFWQNQTNQIKPIPNQNKLNKTNWTKPTQTILNQNQSKENDQTKLKQIKLKPTKLE